MRGFKVWRTVAMASALELATILVAGSVAVVAEESPITLKYVGSWSNLSLYRNFEQPFWSETASAALDDSVRFEVTTFDQMGLKGPEVFRLMEMGLFNVAAATGDYFVSDVPPIEGLDLPALAPDIETARSIAQAYEPVLDEAFQEYHNAKLLAIVPYPAQIVFSKDRINGLADLKGKKVRASGRSTADFIQAVGGIAVNLAFSEVPQALERGVVDAAVTGSLSGYSAGWGEVADYLYPLPIGGWDFVVTAMRLEDWQRLGPDRQQALAQAVKADLENPVFQAIGDETQQGINCLTNAGACGFGTPAGMTLIPIRAEDEQLARQLLTDVVLPRWAARVGRSWVDGWNETIGKVTGLVAGP
ncbi:TRAP transporter substrate-binding protein [Limnochorda pilosa]|uniref:C4-dicarboxylate ABC transporter substrate-binding protein n=1 Tax=Limnochorda pilosa TaxID=1555112 RepID=A0A0K2SLF2_LIMPI|nr:TRAP transporter substrate-binding protein [Limnochorda pilosa]BAS27935.1 C4-dicarboxylate ABC transporter substrate-binding protein [Limnochorda pilosa]